MNGEWGAERLMATDADMQVAPFDGRVTMIALDNDRNLSGYAAGESCREVLLIIANMATEEQAKAILMRIGKIER